LLRERDKGCRPHGWLRGKSRSDLLGRPIFMWRTQEREFGKKVLMGSHVIAGNPAIREDAKENVNRVVGECAAVVRKDRRLTGIVEENVW
jgi:hypothetical protein